MPWQIVPVGLSAIVTVGTNIGLTVIVIGADVAVVGLAHGWFDVKITVTTSPLFNAVELKVAEFVPALTPFTCHW